ncbi:hypothetical protein ACFLQW_00130 [Candidatus Zixiibacteriota bacterium]
MRHRIKKINGRRVPALLVLITLLSLFLTGCKKLELTSKWRDGLVAIDGENHEWGGVTTYLEENNAAVGLLNDEEYLYVSLLTTNRMLQNQIMRAGFTLWFDPEGGKDKTFGIRFPLGMNSGGMDPGGMGFGGRGGFNQPNFDSLQEVFTESQTELEILGPGQDQVRRLPVGDIEDVFVAASISSKGLIYELRIPLSSGEGQPYAIGTSIGEVIGIGLETPEIDRSMMGGKRPGGRGGGMGGGGMRGGAPGGGRRPEMPKPLNVWAKVQLAANSTGDTENHEIVEK